ncbi:MAG: hypothetical protein R3E95_24075 [Thiolinea sp.]
MFIELPKFTKELQELTNISDKWVYFVKNAGNFDYVPDTLQADPCIVDAWHRQPSGLTDEELEAQERRFDFLRVQRAFQDQLKEAMEQRQLTEEKLLERNWNTGRYRKNNGKLKEDRKKQKNVRQQQKKPCWKAKQILPAACWMFWMMPRLPRKPVWQSRKSAHYVDLPY